MNRLQTETIELKIEELKKSLKVDTSEKDWKERLNKNLNTTDLTYKIFRFFGFIIMISSAIIMVAWLFFENQPIFGFEITNQYYGAALLINMISILFINLGKLELRKDRITTFLLLDDLVEK